MQCNERQRRVFHAYRSVCSIEDNTSLARFLTGADAYDNSLRLCAFIELFVEFEGPFQLHHLLNRIWDGRKSLRHADVKMDNLAKASPDSIANVIATIVHSLGQRLVTTGCKGHEMQNVADALSLILTLSGEIVVGKVFHGVLPMLVSGEVALCYSLLLATGLAYNETATEELWDCFVQAMDVKIRERKASIAVIAIVVIIYIGGEGTRTLFPWLYAELGKRNLQLDAKRAWELLGGRSGVWNALAEGTEANWNDQTNSWRHRERLLQICGINEWLTRRDRKGGSRVSTNA